MTTPHRNAVRTPLVCIATAWVALAIPSFAADSNAVAVSHNAIGDVDAQIAAHPGLTGAYVLDTGEEALIARAWLADHAQKTIDVQYFIWSTDNIGILAAEALLRAADRGVKIRVIVDDLLMDAPDQSLLALAKHPNLDIRIYNPKSSVGVPFYKRAWNALTDFRGINQRMHDKTFIVDGKIAITGGRNMAAEYYDYHHTYNFRDRDALLIGPAVTLAEASFERFWASELSVPVEKIYADAGFIQHLDADDAHIRKVYAWLHDYAKAPDNFAPAVRAAVAATATAFEHLMQSAEWCDVDFISDTPGKNVKGGFDGGGLSTTALAKLVANSKDHVVIQSPYLVLSDKAIELFRQTTARGVKARINTNSLAATDNLQAFAGYRNQRDELLGLGLEIFEYRPDAATQTQTRQRELVGALPAGTEASTTFGLHAKTMVVDSKAVFIGTFNLDPRSANLNTEVGVVIRNDKIARQVEASIETDMTAGNSWNAASDDPDQYVGFAKRAKVRFWQLMPVKPLL